ncbi:hypothetical protein PI124_g16383 [Phytophthora idaei]|nr:hypothetical protein PI124_g16383 [Phytophthora idaei]
MSVSSYTAFTNIFSDQKLKELLKSGTKVDDALKLLKLDEVGDDIFMHSDWNTWTKYMAMLNKDNTDEAITAALTRRFGSEKLAEMLAAAQKVPSTKELATKLESAQLKRWMNTGGTPEYIFKILKLDNGADNLFDSAALTSWTNFLKPFNDNFPKKKTTVLDTFKSISDEEGVQKALISAGNSNSPGAKIFKDEMVQRWLDFTTPPANIFKALQLDKAGDDLLSSPLLNTWVQYMQAFNKEIPRKKRRRSNNSQRVTFKRWMAAERSPDDIYTTVLKVESSSSQKADIWRAYYKAYNEQFPGKLFSFTR